MKDKNFMAIISIIFLLVYFIPDEISKLISITFLLFFAPGYFTVKIYKQTSLEEEFLLAIPVSLAISGVLVVILAVLSILKPVNILVAIGIFIALSYFFANSRDIKKIRINKELPNKFVSVILVLLLIGLSITLYIEFSTPQKYEASIEIDSWPQNATLNSTCIFMLYVKNYNYPDENFTVSFSLNGDHIENRSFTLSAGKEMPLFFQARMTKSGKNLASFDLYINGRYYTNVHVYFYVK